MGISVSDPYSFPYHLYRLGFISIYIFFYIGIYIAEDMARYTDDDSWIYKLSKEDLIAELEIRGLPGAGSLPVLQARLTKFEREKEDQNKTLDPVEENSEGSKFSD